MDLLVSTKQAVAATRLFGDCKAQIALGTQIVVFLAQSSSLFAFEGGGRQRAENLTAAVVL